jgi:hypothetical protein
MRQWRVEFDGGEALGAKEVRRGPALLPSFLEGSKYPAFSINAS